MMCVLFYSLCGYLVASSTYRLLSSVLIMSYLKCFLLFSHFFVFLFSVLQDFSNFFSTVFFEFYVVVIILISRTPL